MSDECLKQDNYYVNKPEYYSLKELNNMIMNQTTNITNQEIIDYIIIKNINVNSYIKLSRGIYAPIIYVVSINKNNTALFEWMLNNKAKFWLPLDLENTATYIPEIEYVCDISYINILLTIKKTMLTKISKMPKQNKCNIEHCLKTGDIARIILLDDINNCKKYLQELSVL